MNQPAISARSKNVSYDQFKSINSVISSTIELACSLKPEVSLLIELYEAEKSGAVLSTSSLGLVSEIPPTTTIRYLRFLEERGWIVRSPDRLDRRVVHVRISPKLAEAFDKVFGFESASVPVSDKDAVKV